MAAIVNCNGMQARPEEQTVQITHTYSWEDVYFACPEMHLRNVKIDGISGTKPELDFINFLLLYSPVLQRITVKPVSNIGTELMKELLRFRRASRQAEIIYLDSSQSAFRNKFYTNVENAEAKTSSINFDVKNPYTSVILHSS